jgi:hypothetical protein
MKDIAIKNTKPSGLLKHIKMTGLKKFIDVMA